MTDYTKLVKELRGCKDMDYCTDCPRMANGYVEFCNIKDDAAAAIEDLEGFLSEAERDRDEYEERMRKEQERVIVLQAEVKRLQEKLCDWCAVCPKERRRPEDCELIDREAAISKIEPWLYSEGRGESELNMLRAVIAELKSLPAAPRWHRVEESLPDGKADAIFYYEWTGISGTVYKETSIISLGELIALGCRPIAWMEKPEPPKEEGR